MSAVSAVVYDIGNVLITWHPERLFDEVMLNPDARRKMFDAIDLHAMNDRIDHGENWKAVVYETAEQYPEYADMIRLWHDRWLDMASPRIDWSLSLLRTLKEKGIPVFALSNFGIETFEFARKHYSFLEEFDQKYISGHLGVIKPAPRIYEIVEDNCGIAPESLLFVDDRQENIDAALARNWEAHRFEGPKGWAQCLVDKGLLTLVEAGLTQ